MNASTPKRPRLAQHVFARRHIADGQALVILHDKNSDRRIQLGLREWNIIAAADGTRDMEGIVLAASRRGTLVREPMLRGFFDQLHAAGLLADGPPDEPSETPSPAPQDIERPLQKLPGFSLHCDGQGSCCRLYNSVLFSRVETVRARAFQPLVLDAGDDPEQAFMPERGSVPGPAFCVTLVNGRCAFLDKEDRCSIHTAGGAAAKPFGCSLFPAIFIDDGESIRVSVEVECACVLASVGREDGEPIVPPTAKKRADLPELVFVDVLPPDIRMANGSDSSVPRTLFVAWSQALFEMLAEPSFQGADPIALCWSLAAMLEGQGLQNAEITHQKLIEAQSPNPAELRPWIGALHRIASARASENRSFRAPADLARRAVFWIEHATHMLLDEQDCARCLRSPKPGTPAAAHEMFYLRTSIFGYRLADIDTLPQTPVSCALRDRALRILIARCLSIAMRELDTGEAALSEEPAARFPLALVEAVMRGQALDAYTQNILKNI